MSPASLAGRIGVSQRGESVVIQISVNDTDPHRAMELNHKVAEAFKKKLPK